MARREFKGAAVPTRLLAGIGAGDTSFGLNSNAGWPTGGANGPFTVILDPDVPGKEEVVLVNNQSAGSCTSVTRGFGDSAATSHAVGSDGSVIHGTCRLDPDEANRHINVTTDDDHTQYMKTDGTRHDLIARHTYGGALGTRPVPVAIGTVLAAGTGAQAAAGDHVHTVGVGAINSNTMFTNGVIGAGRLAAGAIDSSGMFAAGIVNAAALGADSVGSSELAPAAIDDTALFGGNLRGTLYTAANPGAVGAGVFWMNTTAAKRALLMRNAANTGWEVIQTMVDIPYTPTLTNFSVGAGTNFAIYSRHGNKVLVNGWIQMGAGATTDGNPFFISLPVNAINTGIASLYFHGAARAFQGGGGAYAAVGLIRGGTAAAAGSDFDRIGIFATAGSPSWNNTTPFTWNGPNADGFTYFAEYSPASLEDTAWV